MSDVDEDAYDDRLEAISARVEAAYPDGVVEFSAMPDDENGLPIDVLDEIAVTGKVVFIAKNDPFFGEGSDYRSAVVENPTWMQVVGIANESVACTGDEHHIFLEFLDHVGATDEGIPIYELQFGS